MKLNGHIFILIVWNNKYLCIILWERLSLPINSVLEVVIEDKQWRIPTSCRGHWNVIHWKHFIWYAMLNIFYTKSEHFKPLSLPADSAGYNWASRLNVLTFQRWVPWMVKVILVNRFIKNPFEREYFRQRSSLPKMVIQQRTYWRTYSLTHSSFMNGKCIEID